MNQPPPLPGAPVVHPLQRHSTLGRKLLIAGAVLLGVCGLAAASTVWWWNHNLHAAPLQPVQLSAAEQTALDQKVREMKTGAAPASDPSKTIVLSEREINGFLKEQCCGEQVKVKIDNGAITATALVPFDKDVPIIGGHTVRLKVAVNTELDKDHRLALRVTDVNVGGISPPNAWLGGIKGVNLLADDSKNSPFKDIADGIKSFDVKNGEVRVVLND
jgi:hypothetical protein